MQNDSTIIRIRIIVENDWYEWKQVTDYFEVYFWSVKLSRVLVPVK